MPALNVCLLGGTGFVGRAIAARLAQGGHRQRVPTRRHANHRDLLVHPGLVLVEGDVHEPSFLRRQFEGMDVVINLVGILNSRDRAGRQFERVHVELPGKVAQACEQAGVKRLLHMSALHATRDAPSRYLRTKAAGEEAAHAASPELRVTSFRPSVIFGSRDGFTNRFAGLLRLAPGVFPLACPDSRFQPVYVEDVAQAFVAAIPEHRTFGRRYDLCGPRIYTLREIVAYVAELQGKRVRILGLGDRLSRLQAAVLELAPGKPFSRDNYRSLTVDSVCAEGANALRGVFGVMPTPLERVAPGWLTRGRTAPR
ncbi:epimerase [Sulfurifustis variabilis]|uniref:Epimerase n=1 Tax=Sulfurifustis variabilis TaxID=1675686 RepID=A0A1B4UZZ6_9GAMM|nr:complex I NDUFA9 subunit family protein [Sulfurifustis variabilis]BAU46736.1 epimerase [Sulfurifustis variabilis]